MSLANVMRGFLGGNPAPTAPVSGESMPVGNTNLAPLGSSNPGAFNNGTNLADLTGPAGENIVVSAGSIKTEPASKSVMEQLDGLWQIDPAEKGALPSAVPNLSIDPNKLAEAVSRMNFTSSLTPDLMQKALSGDQAAFSQAINQAAQTAFAQSLQAASKMTEHALAQQAVSFKALLPNEVKKMQIGDSLTLENPVFANPTIQPFVTMLRDQLAVKYPAATGAELTGMAKGLFSELAAEIQKPEQAAQQKTKQQTSAAADKGVDWDNFFAS